MKINGLSLLAGMAPSVERPAADQQAAKKSQNLAPKGESSHKVPDDSPKLPGVIRLLQEGHFKGVADVRLRINFFDELQALQERELRSTAGQAIPGFLEAMDKGLETLLASESLSADQASAIMAQKDRFTQAVGQLLDNSQGTPNFSQETLLTAIDAAFQELAASIQSILAPAEALSETPGLTEGGDGELAPLDSLAEAVPETPATAATAGEALLETLKSSYASALAALQETLAEAATLPPLSEPEGRGQAYAKFLSIYNNLLEGAPRDEPLNAETLDTVA